MIGVGRRRRRLHFTSLQAAFAANEVYEVAATFNLEDGQVFGAVFISLIAGILATRLGTELYK